MFGFRLLETLSKTHSTTFIPAPKNGSAVHMAKVLSLNSRRAHGDKLAMPAQRFSKNTFALL
jgi:hypothetical protein